jgi:hypothetical protein
MKFLLIFYSEIYSQCVNSVILSLDQYIEAHNSHFFYKTINRVLYFNIFKQIAGGFFFQNKINIVSLFLKKYNKSCRTTTSQGPPVYPLFWTFRLILSKAGPTEPSARNLLFLTKRSRLEPSPLCCTAIAHQKTERRAAFGRQKNICLTLSETTIHAMKGYNSAIIYINNFHS